MGLIDWYSMGRKSIRSGILFALCIAIPLGVGAVGSIFTLSAIPTWYATLQKPFINPPNWVFAPVWTALYILMGISLWLILKNGIRTFLERQGAILFSLQLGVNLLWSLVFFGMHSVTCGLIIIVILCALIAATIYTFNKVSNHAAWLLVPYFLWSCFAAVLNAMIFMLN